MLIKRSKSNPIVTPDMVKPSQKAFKVDGAFNAGIIEFQGEILMLLRVAESIPNDNKNEISVPCLFDQNGNKGLSVRTFKRDDPNYDFSDPRAISRCDDPRQVYLTSLSHIRIARSQDGEQFVVDDLPFIFPDNPYEAYGCEDPRVTLIEGNYYINYSSVSKYGISTSLARTHDFKLVERLGLIFSPDNRDVCLFSEKINGYYWALHRPAPLHLGAPEIWLAKSPDLIHWGDHCRLAGCSDNKWESMKIGGGTPMIKTEKGWLQIYHGVDDSQRYSLGALLIDLDNPKKVIARSKKPIIEPEETYEIEGFFNNVVFSCGAIVKDGLLNIYYGAADEVMAVATITLNDLWKNILTLENTTPSKQ